jgi:predicted MFS family arabinose efflux permease
MSLHRDRRALLILLAMVSFMNYADRMVLPAVAQSVKLEFGLSDTRLGLLNGFVFVLLYAATSLPLTRLADRTSRGMVLASALAFWSLATAACGMAKVFGQLVVARACVGIGESACQPVGYALVCEQLPAQQRNVGISWFLFGNNLGITAGFALGGWLGAQYGWRAAFIAVALPGLLIALLLALITRRMLRQAGGDVTVLAAASTPYFSAVKQLFMNPTYRLLVWLSGIFAFTIFGPIAFLPAFFVRSHGLPMGTVGAMTGLAIGLGMAVGVLLGGATADRLSRRSLAQPQFLCAVTILLSGLSFVAALLATNPWWAFAMTFVAAIFGSIASPIISTAVQNESPPELRATAASYSTLAVSVLGIGLAPLLIGMLSDILTPAYGKESLRWALLASLTACIITSALHYRVGSLLQKRGMPNGRVMADTEPTAG